MRLYIEDMTCGSCVKHVTAAIRTVDPVAKVEADTVSRKVSVETAAVQEAILKALSDDGYPAIAA